MDVGDFLLFIYLDYYIFLPALKSERLTRMNYFTLTILKKFKQLLFFFNRKGASSYYFALQSKIKNIKLDLSK